MNMNGLSVGLGVGTVSVLASDWAGGTASDWASDCASDWACVGLVVCLSVGMGVVPA